MQPRSGPTPNLMPDGGGCRVATAVVGGCRLGHNRTPDGSSARHQGQLGVTEGLLWEPRQACIGGVQLWIDKMMGTGSTPTWMTLLAANLQWMIEFDPGPAAMHAQLLRSTMCHAVADLFYPCKHESKDLIYCVPTKLRCLTTHPAIR
jgi:hypothetical protein